jgi:hypothetical protein
MPSVGERGRPSRATGSQPLGQRVVVVLAQHALNVLLSQLLSIVVARLVDLDDLLDAQDVAELIGLTNPGGLPTYRARYDDFPDPVWRSRGGRCQLWLRQDVVEWAKKTGRLT